MVRVDGFKSKTGSTGFKPLLKLTQIEDKTWIHFAV